MSYAPGAPAAKPDEGNREAKPAVHDPDWSRKCEVCKASPVHPLTGMCGPCTFGESEAAGGNW